MRNARALEWATAPVVPKAGEGSVYTETEQVSATMGG
jgi:hypothetical protein